MNPRVVGICLILTTFVRCYTQTRIITKIIDMFRISAKTGVALLACALLLAGCSGGKTFKVKGVIQGAKNGVLYLQREENGRYVDVDSLELGCNGRIELAGRAEEPQMYYLAFGKSEPALSFFADGAPVQVQAHIDSLDRARITAGDEQALYNEFMDYMRDFAARKEAVYLDILRSGAVDGAKDSLEIYRAMYEKLDRRQLQFVANFALSHPESRLSPLLAYTFLNKGYSPLLDTIAAKFTPEVAASRYGQEFATFVSNAKNTLVGMSAPQFELKTDSLTCRLEDFAGKNLFVVAWTAGDQANADYLTALKKVYEKWHPKGLEVLTSCIGGNDEDYRYDTYTLAMPWQDVRDARGVKSTLVEKFALTGTLPTGVLIGPDGIILARYVSPEGLEVALDYLSKQ